MKSFLMKLLVITPFCIFFSTCNGIKTDQVSEHPDMRSSLTVSPTFTYTAILSSTTTTPFPTSPEFVTMDSSGSKCTDPNAILDTRISPNSKWFTAACFKPYMEGFSPLHVVSIDHSKEWKIYFRDFILPGSNHHDDIIIPYHWSKDGKYFYVVTPSRLSGCCWLGGYYVLLVRLNLETGEQVALLNGSDYDKYVSITFTISDNDRYLLFTPVSHQPYDVAVQDLSTLTTQTFSLNYPGAIDLTYAIMSDDNTKIVMPLFKQHEFNDFRVTSIVMIDLATDKQTLLISSLKEGNELFPIRFQDTTYVLFSSIKPDDSHDQSSAEFWLANIQTGALQKVENP